MLGEDARLGAALDEAGQRYDEIDVEFVEDLGPAVHRHERVGAVEGAHDVALDEVPRESGGQLRIVVLEHVVGAAPESRRPVLDAHGSTRVVAAPHDGFLDVAGPLGIALEIEHDLETPLGTGVNLDRLGGTLTHGHHLARSGPPRPDSPVDGDGRSRAGPTTIR